MNGFFKIFYFKIEKRKNDIRYLTFKISFWTNKIYYTNIFPITIKTCLNYHHFRPYSFLLTSGWVLLWQTTGDTLNLGCLPSYERVAKGVSPKEVMKLIQKECLLPKCSTGFFPFMILKNKKSAHNCIE